MQSLAVVSDIHINKGRRKRRKDARDILAREEEFRRLLRGVEENEPVSTPLVALGDLTNNGRAYEFEALERIIKEEVDEERDVFVVGGNHDVGFKGTFPRRSARERLIASAGRIMGRPAVYPISVDVGALVTLILVDSVSATIRNPFSLARGRIGYAQRQAVKAMIRDAISRGRRPVVGTHHHAFYYGVGLELVDSAEFLECLDGAAVLMFGHKHDRAEWSELYGVERIFSVGCSTDSLDYLRIDVLEDARAVWQYVAT